MNKFVKSILNLSELEELASQKNWINQLHPTLKILLTSVYIIWVASIDKYELSNILLLGLYPIAILSISDVPTKTLCTKLVIPTFISIGIGIFNPILNRETLLIIGSIHISAGTVSFVVLLIKAVLTISATLILVATTTMDQLCKGLEVLKIPSKLIMLFMIMYRYIVVLLNEIGKTIEAYQLRASYKKGIHISVWGSLIGQILIRSYKRSEEIYDAMLLRGYHLGEKNE